MWLGFASLHLSTLSQGTHLDFIVQNGQYCKVEQLNDESHQFITG